MKAVGALLISIPILAACHRVQTPPQDDDAVIAVDMPADHPPQSEVAEKLHAAHAHNLNRHHESRHEGKSENHQHRKTHQLQVFGDTKFAGENNGENSTQSVDEYFDKFFALDVNVYVLAVLDDVWDHENFVSESFPSKSVIEVSHDAENSVAAFSKSALFDDKNAHTGGEDVTAPNGVSSGEETSSDSHASDGHKAKHADHKAENQTKSLRANLTPSSLLILSDVPSLAEYSVKHRTFGKQSRRALFNTFIHPSCDAVSKEWLAIKDASGAQTIQCDRVKDVFTVFSSEHEKVTAHKLSKGSCQALLVAEGSALEKLQTEIAVWNEGPLVVLVAPLSAAECFKRSHRDEFMAHVSSDLLLESLAALKTSIQAAGKSAAFSVVAMSPEHAASKHAMASLAADILEFETPSNRRRLQAVANIEAESKNRFVAVDRELQGADGQIDLPASEKKKAAKKLGDDPNDNVLTYAEAERRLIWIWTSVALLVAVLMSIGALVYMPFNPDPMLYTKLSATR